MWATPEELSTIAHYELVKGAEMVAPEMKGFLKAYCQTLTKGQQTLIARYAKIQRRAARDLARLIEQGQAARAVTEKQSS